MVNSNLEWLYTYHPDWIMYNTDQVTPSWAFSNQLYPTINIGDPTASAYLGTQIVANAAGFRGIALDNVSADVATARGHYSGVTTPCIPASRPACGGTWVQDYARRYDDSAYLAANLSHLQRIAAIGHSNNLTLIANLSYYGGPDWVKMSQAVDGVLVENTPHDGDGSTSGVSSTGGYNAGFVVDQLFLAGLYNAKNSSGKGLYIANAYTVGSPVTVNFSSGSANITGTGLPTTAGQPTNFTFTTLPTGFNPSTTYYICSGATSTSITVSATYTTTCGSTVTAGSVGSGAITNPNPNVSSADMSTNEIKYVMAWTLLTTQNSKNYFSADAQSTTLVPNYPELMGGPQNFTTTATTNSTATLSSIGSMTGLAPGLLVTGNGIPNGTYIETTTATTVTLTKAATASASGVTITVSGVFQPPLGTPSGPPPAVNATTLNQVYTINSADCGWAGGTFFPSGTATVCSRQFTNGWVYMNPVCRMTATGCGTTSVTFTIPAAIGSGVWYDTACNVVSAGSYTLYTAGSLSTPAGALIIARGSATTCPWPR
jgi:hypothetical protein